MGCLFSGNEFSDSYMYDYYRSITFNITQNKMSEESSTQYLEKKHPLIKAIIDYALRRIEIIIMLALMGGGFTFNSCRANNLQKAVQQQGTLITNVVEYVTKP